MKHQHLEEALKGAARRLLSGENRSDVYGMDVTLLAKHQLGEDVSFLIEAIETKLNPVDPRKMPIVEALRYYGQNLEEASKWQSATGASYAEYGKIGKDLKAIAEELTVNAFFLGQPRKLA
jgi:hypothetical protein